MCKKVCTDCVARINVGEYDWSRSVDESELRSGRCPQYDYSIALLTVNAVVCGSYQLVVEIVLHKRSHQCHVLRNPPAAWIRPLNAQSSTTMITMATKNTGLTKERWQTHLKRQQKEESSWPQCHFVSIFGCDGGRPFVRKQKLGKGEGSGCRHHAGR